MSTSQETIRKKAGKVDIFRWIFRFRENDGFSSTRKTVDPKRNARGIHHQ